LARGEFRPGQAIPSELDLAARYQVSQGTVRKAIDELAAENLLLRRQGKGTFVATHHEASVRYRFLRLTPDDGEPRVSGSRVLDCRRQKADHGVAAQLGLHAGETIINIRRLLAFDGQPTVLDDICLPGDVFHKLTADVLARYRGPLYSLFETEFGVSMVRADEKIRAVAAQATQAKLLEVEPNAPLLLVERVSYTYGDQAVEVRRGLWRTEQFHYRNMLN